MRRSSDYDDDEDHDPRDPPRTSNKPLLIILGVVAGILCVCLVVCGGLFYLGMQAFNSAMGGLQTVMAQAQQAMQDVQAAQAAADSFMRDVAANRINDAYAGTTPEFQSRITLAEFQNLVNRNPALKSYQTGVTLQNTNFTPTLVIFQGNVSAPTGAFVSFTLELAKEGTAWKVDRFTIP